MAPIRTSQPPSWKEPPKKKSFSAKGRKSKAKNFIDEKLAPINTINEAFVDMIANAFKLKLKVHGICDLEDVFKAFGAGTIRVGTMCSGTDAPVVAFELLKKVLHENHNTSLLFYHVFSAEIVVFKQGFIRSTCDPPILFRDIREMAQPKRRGEKAATAFGSLEEIPGDIHILIAGFSCVDFSLLNPKRKSVEDGGESGDTLQYIAGYAKLYRPAIIILENVDSAPWPQIKALWENDRKWLEEHNITLNYWGDEPGYVAHVEKVNTRDYYIPQTRNRRYMVLLDLKRLRRMDETMESARKMTETWYTIFRSLKRPASSSLEEWLLPDGDPLVQQARRELSKKRARSTTRPAWHLVKLRHSAYRRKMELGTQRPLTKWIEEGTAKAPDHWWQEHAQVQVERIWDTWDISYLRSASRDGYDVLFKYRVWDISQSVDRSIDTTGFGLAGCLTPRGMQYLTYNGRPLTGKEHSMLQGLPIEKLTLTRESHKELVDLAGNAMSVSVVGVAILSSLLSLESLISNALAETKTPPSHEMTAKRPVQLNYDYLLLPKIAGLDHAEHIAMERILIAAALSTRLCPCEWEQCLARTYASACKDCGYIGCAKCSGIPPHRYTGLDQKTFGRIEPSTFIDMLKKAFPMRLSIRGLPHRKFRALVKTVSSSRLTRANDDDLRTWLEGLKDVLGQDLYLQLPKRTHCWTVVYEGKSSRLELKFQYGSSQWSFYGKPKAKEAVNSAIRRLFKEPIAQMRPSSKGLLRGRWEIIVPLTQSFKINIKGGGKLVDSWENKLGLPEKHQSRKVWSTLRITVAPMSHIQLDQDISGIYDLKDNCGMACNSLHKRRAPEGRIQHALNSLIAEEWDFESSARHHAIIQGIFSDFDNEELGFSDDYLEEGFNSHEEVTAAAEILQKVLASSSEHSQSPKDEAQVYFYLDPDRIGPPKEDRFVFSVDKHRTAYREIRDKIATVERWRQSDERTSTVTATTCGKRFKCGAFISTGQGKQAISAVVGKHPIISTYSDFKSLDDYDESAVVCYTPAPPSHTKAIRSVDQLAEKLYTVENQPPPARSDLFLMFNSNHVPCAEVALGCQQAPLAILVCELDSLTFHGRNSKHGQWEEVSQSEQTQFLEKHAWLLERSRDLAGFDKGWHETSHPNQPLRCSKCAPVAPKIAWIMMLHKTTKRLIPRIKAMEDPEGCSLYEKAFRTRPNPWTFQIRVNSDGLGCLQIGLNVPTLAHRAIGTILDQLPDSHTSLTDLDIQWRLDTNYDALVGPKLKPFSIAHNHDTKPVPVVFPGVDDEGNSLTLRIEQQRTLGCMRGCEDEGSAPFYRQEIEEAAIPQLKWRVEARVRTPLTILGGVRADETGYGKTATMLALILTDFLFDTKGNSRQMQEALAKQFHKSDSSGYILLQATLILVPKHLFTQWTREITRFLGNSYNKLAIMNMKDLEMTTVQAFEEAHIVLISDALFHPRYWSNVARFAGMPEISTTNGRAFASWLEEICYRSREHTDLMKVSVGSMVDHVESLYQQTSSNSAFRPNPNTKRHTGKDYAAKKASRSDEENQASRELDPRSYDQYDDAKKKKDYRLAKSPCLQMFKFRRIVIDEYQLIAYHIQIYMSESLRGISRWILSATPRLDSFNWVRNMMRLIGVNVGVIDGAPTRADGLTLNEIRNSMTDRERFLTFHKTHSSAWHEARQIHAQAAMDQFVRKSFAETSEIPMELHIKVISLSCHELVRYMRHQQRLESQNMQNYKEGCKQTQGVLGQRLNKDILSSASGAELLVKAASFIPPVGDSDEVQMMLESRENDVQTIISLFQREVRHAAWLHAQCLRAWRATNSTIKQTYYEKWKDSIQKGDLGDKDARKLVMAMIEEAESMVPYFVEEDFYRKAPTEEVLKAEKAKTVKYYKNITQVARQKTTHDVAIQKTRMAYKVNGRPFVMPTRKATDSDGPLMKPKLTRIFNIDHALYVSTLRLVISNLAQLSDELVSRLRALRFDVWAQNMQSWKTQNSDESAPYCDLGSCLQRAKPDEIQLNMTCGHMTCAMCIKTMAKSMRCPHENCNASAGAYRLKTASDLTGAGHSTTDGSKVDAIIELVTGLPEEDQVLIFVQHEETMERIERALDENGINNWALVENLTPANLQKITTGFQDDHTADRRKVLILRSGSGGSAGLNLTGPNHLIFVSPFITKSQQEYEASMVQCVGRARRYGQRKRVHVYRFIALRTIDVDTIYHHEGVRPVQRSGKWELLKDEELAVEELEVVRGYSGGYKPGEKD